MIKAQRSTGRDSLEQDAQRILQRIRRAFAGIIDVTCGPAPSTTDIAERIGVYRKLAWQIGKVAYTPDSLSAARYVPSAGNMKTFLAAARRRQVPVELVDAAAAAVREFEQLIRTHADDRESLDLMLLSCSSQPDDQAEVALRQSAFLGNAFVWGAQAKTRLVANVVRGVDDPNRFELLRLRGFLGFRRNRPNRRYPIAYTRAATDEWQPIHDVPEPIASEAPLLREFCSTPPPEFTRRLDDHGFLVDELMPGPVGNTGAVTFFTAELSRNPGSRYRDQENTFNEFAARVQTPTEAFIFDVLIDDGLFGRVAPVAQIYSELNGPSARVDDDLLPLTLRVAHLGRGLDVLPTPDVPRYATVMQSVFDKLGWDAGRFDVYRLRIEYPPMPTVVTITHPLPQPPEKRATEAPT